MNSQDKCPVPMNFGSKRWIDGDSSWQDCPITIRNGGCPRCMDIRGKYKSCEKGWMVCHECYPIHCMLRGAEDNSHPVGCMIWA